MAEAHDLLEALYLVAGCSSIGVMWLTNSPLSLEVVQMWLQPSQAWKFELATLLVDLRSRGAGRLHAGQEWFDMGVGRLRLRGRQWAVTNWTG